MKWISYIGLICIGAALNSCAEKETVNKPQIAQASLERPKLQEKPTMTINWHWENRFERGEVQLIKNWLGQINGAITQTFGHYPFEMNFFIHRAKLGNEPVPWAHTTRGKEQGVHFHVNMNYKLEDFLNDWTAQHEISHLSIPFVGKENAWFSEGYATYMQCQVMQRQGVMSVEEVKNKYQTKLSGCKTAFESKMPVPQAADSLKKAWNYPAMYWGGVSFFWKLNEQYVKALDKTVVEVVKEYVACCRVNDSSPMQICKSWDKISGTTLATDLLKSYQNEPAKMQFDEF